MTHPFRGHCASAGFCGAAEELPLAPALEGDSRELGREPTNDELGKEIGIASDKIARLRRVGIRPASLDAPMADDDSTEFGEIIGDEEAQTPFELLRDKNLRNEMGDLLDLLDEREKTIISQRFGFGGGKPKTLEDVSKNFGVTR